MEEDSKRGKTRGRKKVSKSNGRGGEGAGREIKEKMER